MTEAAGSDEERVSLSAWLWLAGLVGVVVALIAMVATSSGSSRWDDDTREQELQALTQCEKFVEKRLKAPSTAKFNLTAHAAGESTWNVRGTVDSQNSFGAMIRNDVTCKIRLDTDTETAHLENIEVG